MTLPREGVARVLLVVAGVSVIVGLVATGCVEPTAEQTEAHRRFWSPTPAERCRDVCAPASVLSFEHSGWSGTTCHCGGTTAAGGAGAGR